MTDRDPTNATLDEWIADLDAANAEIEAGHIVPGEVVFDELEARLARLEARQSPPRPERAATPR